jgi:predicted amidohydrolase YtcJ
MTSSRTKLNILAFVTILGCLAASRPLAAQNADTILHNGKIITVDKNFAIAEAKEADVMKLAGPSTKLIDLKGRTVIPGLIDTHNHIHDYAETNYGGYIGSEGLLAYPMDWRGVKTVEDIVNQVRGTIAKYKIPPGTWMYFASIGDTGGAAESKIMFDDLNRYELDKAAPQNGVVMALGFPNANGLVVNSIVIDKLWADFGDFIKKDGRYWVDQSGKPEGHLEAPAVRLPFEYLPTPTPANAGMLYKMYNEELNAEGVTTASTRLPQYSIDAFKYLENRGELTLRMPYGLEGYFGRIENLDELKEAGKLIGTGTDLMWAISAAPSAVDGAGVRSCTNLPKAANFSNLDTWWPRGQCILDSEYKGAKGAAITDNYFRNYIFKSAQYGARFANTHITGDRSIKMMLGMMDELSKQYGPNSVKGWAFDHCFLVDPSDLPHAAKLGAMFSCYSQVNGVSEIATAWGDKVANTYSIPVKSMMKAGAIAAYESDGDKSKWKDLQWFMERKDPKGKVWGPQERLDHQEVLRYFTINGAEYVLRGNKIGSLETGKWADLVVLDKEFLATDASQMKDMQPQMTMLGGKVVFATPAFADENDLRKQAALVSTLQDLKARRKRLGFSRR